MILSQAFFVAEPEEEGAETLGRWAKSVSKDNFA
jgi:hypothetical protein